MSTTQNVKGNRKIVVALFDFKQYFTIPDGLDLEDQTVVSSWSVSWENFILIMSMVARQQIL